MSMKPVGVGIWMRGSSRAVAGRILSWTAKMYWSDRPRTKTGIETPMSEITVTKPSPKRLRSPGGEATERDAEAGREDQGGESQLDRAREAGHETAQDRPVVDEAVAQVAVDQVVM